jgi:hypothetical protein
VSSSTSPVGRWDGQGFAPLGVWATRRKTFQVRVCAKRWATGLKNGTSYTFEVSAINVEEESAPATTNEVTTPTFPGTPSMGATEGDGSALVTWQSPGSNGGSTITSYTVTVIPGGTSFTRNFSTFSAETPGLTNGASGDRDASDRWWDAKWNIYFRKQLADSSLQRWLNVSQRRNKHARRQLALGTSSSRRRGAVGNHWHFEGGQIHGAQTAGV